MTQRATPIRTSHNSLEDSIRVISQSRKHLAHRLSECFPSKDPPANKVLRAHSSHPSLGHSSFFQNSLVHSRSDSFDTHLVFEGQLSQELMKIKVEAAERRSEQRARDIELQEIIQSAGSEDSVVTVKSYDVEPTSIITFIESDEKNEEETDCFETCRAWKSKCECF
mmetsp:Transcript_23668/g.41925  ORF Transcript_23668/g.41925 Transcript_23668/m.41925 type:complete len:167 (+) Transcript_23668:1190-1690(+)